MVGTSWGVGIAFDAKGANRNKWNAIRRDAERRVIRRSSTESGGLTGQALEAAVGRIGQMFPGHVIYEAAP